MSERIVELLIPVQIDHHAGQVGVIAARLGEKLLEHLSKMTPVIETGERIRRRHLLHLLQRFFELVILLAQITQRPFQFRTQTLVFALDLGDRQVLFHHQRDGIEIIPEFDDVIRCALADGLRGDAHDIFSGYHNQRSRAAPANVVQKLDSIAVRKIVIGQDDVERRQVLRQCGGPPVGLDHGSDAKMILQCLADQLALVAVVLH